MKENVLFDDQEKITLADDEVDAIEQYIDNSATRTCESKQSIQ